MLGRDSYSTLRLQSSRYELQIADSAAERIKGLGGRSIPANAGMLFVYDAPVLPCFWMKDTRVALDMIWLDHNKKIIHIVADVTPGTYPKTFCPPNPAQYVIELPAGEAARNHVKPGDRLSF
jgi:uncharacterized protein